MKRLIITGVATFLAAVAGCALESETEQQPTTESNVTSKDWIEGAYAKQGGTPVHFVFFRGKEGEEDDSYFGEIEKDGTNYRAAGKFNVGQDKYGTVIKLTIEERDDKGTKEQKEDKEDTEDKDGGPSPPAGDAGAAADPSIVDLAFGGSKHFLKIGENDSILVRADETSKTAHYKRVKTWCGKKGAKDCSASVQNTGLSCSGSALSCTSKHECACK